MVIIKKIIITLEPGPYGMDTHLLRLELRNYGGKDATSVVPLPTDHLHSMFDRVFEHAKWLLKQELEKA